MSQKGKPKGQKHNNPGFNNSRRSFQGLGQENSQNPEHENFQKPQTSGHENPRRAFHNLDHDNSQKVHQHFGGKPFNQRYDKNQDQLSDKSNYQKPPPVWGPPRKKFSSAVETENVESERVVTRLDSLENQCSSPNIHSTITVQIANNPTSGESRVVNEVPSDPSVGIAVPTVQKSNLINVKVISINEKFNQMFNCMLNSHPDKDRYLSEFLNCGSITKICDTEIPPTSALSANALTEKCDTEIPPASALSVNAPEFQMRLDKCSSNEPVNKLSEIQQLNSSDISAEQDHLIDTASDEVSNEQATSNWNEEEEHEGAVGGETKDKSSSGWDQDGDAWEQGEGAWGNSKWEEKENLPDNRESEVTNKKFDKKRNNKKEQGKQNDKGKVKEEYGDLFTASDDTSLAHCVAADMRMGSGIAVTFKRDFKKEGELLDQKKRVGQVAILENKGRFIYYLVTKKYSNGKPRYEDLESSLIEMKDHCVEKGVKKLSMPRIGCGLDRLEWSRVKPMIEKIFSDVDISITVYTLNTDADHKYPSRSKAKYVNRPISLLNIESETGLVFFGAEDGNMDECGKMLDNKFNFALDFRKAQKNVGSVLTFEKKSEYIYGLVVKKKISEPLSYVNLEKCLLELKKKTKKDNTFFIGFQAFCDDDDELATEKLITIVRNVFFLSDIEIHICYPKNLEYLHRVDEGQGFENNKNSEEMGRKEVKSTGERKVDHKNRNQQGGDKQKETSKNWRDK